MANSTRFKELNRRISELRRNMLPAKFSPTGDYSRRQLDRARGYRLLVHAEIESFIEDITFEAAKRNVVQWNASRKVSHSLFCLMAHYHKGFANEDPELEVLFPEDSRPKVKEAIKEVVDIAIRQYQSIHAKNNGIKEKNLYRLILPVGVRREDLDDLWITNLSEFGKRRGDVAHKSIKAQQEIDPRFEF